MQKSKSKRQPKNFFLYLVDEFIFIRREFYFESQVPAGILASKLNDLGYSREGKKRNIRTKLLKTEEGWDFELSLGFGRGTIFVEANGNLYQNNSGLTVITGSSIILKFLNLMALFYVATAVCALVFGSQDIAFLIFLACFIFVLWIDIYRDRNKALKVLQQEIELVSNDAKAKTS